MTRRSPARTWLAALLGVWFAVSGDLSAHLVCRMHTGLPAANVRVATMDMPSAAPATMDHAAHMAAAALDGPQHEPVSPDGHEPHGCRCLTDCCSTAPATSITGGVITVSARVMVSAVREMQPGVIPAPASARSHVLPFANGPPPAVSA